MGRALDALVVETTDYGRQEITLSRQCECCHGGGRVTVIKKGVKRSDIPDGICDEDDDWNKYFATVECGECDGFGAHITDEGEVLLRFLKRFKDND